MNIPTGVHKYIFIMTESYWFDLTVVFGMKHLLFVALFFPPLYYYYYCLFLGALLFAASRLWYVGSRQLGCMQGQMINMSGLKIFPKWHRNANWFWNKNILVTFRLGYCKIHITWGYHLGEKNEKGNVKTKGNSDLLGPGASKLPIPFDFKGVPGRQETSLVCFQKEVAAFPEN